ncbi:hypothetical protein IAQ61_002634 [Plenodomus lingam]|uniref:uncharacterized protein n=1 Tax=Leptosphaeria maculans TaxID=5022 RepID=UPI003320E4B2|nr:hypothetical protein IAQ61_002634 [Plenodomus lingam]
MAAALRLQSRTSKQGKADNEAPVHSWGGSLRLAVRRKGEWDVRSGDKTWGGAGEGEESSEGKRDIDWITAGQRFVSAADGASSILPDTARGGNPRSVTHPGRRDALHDYSTTRSKRLCHARRVPSLQRPPERVLVVQRLQLDFQVSGLAHNNLTFTTLPFQRQPAPVSVSSQVPQFRLHHWPHLSCQSKRRHCPDVAPGNALPSKKAEIRSTQS